MNSAVLVVEDDYSLREALCDTLSLAGIPVKAVADGNEALKAIETSEFSMVVSDVHMPDLDGHGLMQLLKERHPNLPVVLMTAYGNVEKAVQAMREGAADYLVKPFEAEVLVNMVNRYLNQVEASGAVVAEDPKTLKMIALAERVAATDVTVMLNGESGVGKEVVAQHIHRSSPRACSPFVAINCAAIPDNMLEAVLFGYEKGAFTGAYQASAGKFEQAQDGTLLLDEISEMDLALQAKLLRVIQEREVERLGGKKTIPLNVRIIATTNRNLKAEVEAGRFREDLYYRLNVFPIRIPPLRERMADVIPMAEFFIKRHQMPGMPMPELTETAKAALIRHAWPGNVRELENVMQRAQILSNGDTIRAEDIVFEMDEDMPIEAVPELVCEGGDKRLTADLRVTEYQIILDALRKYGSKKQAATELGVSPRTLRYKMARMREEGLVIPGEEH